MRKIIYGSFVILVIQKGNTKSPTDLYKIADAWWAKLKEIKCKLL